MPIARVHPIDDKPETWVGQGTCILTRPLGNSGAWYHLRITNVVSGVVHVHYLVYSRVTREASLKRQTSEPVPRKNEVRDPAFQLAFQMVLM